MGNLTPLKIKPEMHRYLKSKAAQAGVSLQFFSNRLLERAKEQIESGELKFSDDEDQRQQEEAAQ